ncbi:MAG: alpha/beta hydrolase [Alphaproteobacteria bacterium]|nr:alpha/beta hydrolase [Alphaproteobacteria bacterium]
MPEVTSRDGVSLFYEVHDHTDPWKDAPILVLQHGFGRSAKFWRSLVPYLSRNFKVVCPDLRGLGRSSAEFDAERAITAENYIADLIAIIDDLGAPRVHYAGESLAGILGFILAAEHPDRIRSFCALSTPPFIIKQTHETFAFGHRSWGDALLKMGSVAWARAANMATRFPPDADPGLLEWYASEMGKSNVAVMVNMARLLETIDSRPYLPRVKAPVLGLYPTNAATVTAEQERMLLEMVPNIRIVHLPTRYHMVWMLQPAACAAHMRHFMALTDGSFCYD